MVRPPRAISTMATMWLRCSRMKARFDSMYARKKPEPVEACARAHVGLALLEDFEHHLLDQVVLAGEVVADQAPADTQPCSNAGERRPRVADLGDRIDRCDHDLRPSGGLDESPLLSVSCRCWLHDQKASSLAKEPGTVRLCAVKPGSGLRRGGVRWA